MDEKLDAFDPRDGGILHAVHPETGEAIEVHMPSFDAIDRHGREVDEILRDLEANHGIYGALVSDRSSLYDFMLDEGEVAAMSKRLGVEIDPAGECLLVDIAESMSKRGPA